MQNLAQGRQFQPQQQNRLVINNDSYGLSNIRKHSAGSVEILNENSNERLHGMQAQQRGAHLNRLQHNAWKSKSTTRINQMAAGQPVQGNVRRSSSNRAMPGTPGPSVLSAANSSSNLNQSSKLAVASRGNLQADTSITQFAIADDCSNYGQATGTGMAGRSSNADRLGGMTLVSKWCASFEDDQDDADNSANDLGQVDDLAAAGIAQSPTNEDIELSKKLKKASLNEERLPSDQQINKCLSKPTNEQQHPNDANQPKETADGLKCIVNSNSSQKIRLQIIPSSNVVVDSGPDNEQQEDKRKEDEDDDDQNDEDDDDDEEEVELVILEKKIIKNGKVIQVTEEIIEEKSIPKQRDPNKNQDKKINKNQVQDKSKERSKFFEFLDEPDGRITNIVVKTSSPPVLTTAKPVILNRQPNASPIMARNRQGPMQQEKDRFNAFQVVRPQPGSIECIDTKKNSVNEDSKVNGRTPNAVIRRRDAKRSPISLRSYSDPEHFTGMPVKANPSGFLYANDGETDANYRKGSINVQHHKAASRQTNKRLNQLLVKSFLPIKQRALEKKLKQLNLPRSWSCPLISAHIRSSISPPLRQQLSFQNFNEDFVYNLDITRNIAIICGKSDNQLESSARKHSVFCYNNGLLSSSLPNLHLALEEDRIPLHSEPCAYFKHNNLTKEESGGSSASNSSHHNLYNNSKEANKNQLNKSDSNVENKKNQQQQQHQYSSKSDGYQRNQPLLNTTSDSDKCDDDVPSQTNKPCPSQPILSNKTSNYFAQRRALQSVEDQDDDEDDDVEEEEQTDPNAIYNYGSAAKRYGARQIASPPDSNLLKSFSGSTGRMNRLGSTGSTTAYNSALSSVNANRSPYNQVTRSSTTSNICNFSANTNLLNAKLSSGFNSSLTGLSSLTTSNPLAKLSLDMPMPFRRKKRTVNAFNSSPLSPSIYNASSTNYTFNNHLNNLSNYNNGSYTNLHNVGTGSNLSGNAGTGVIGNSTTASKYLPSSEFFLRNQSSPSSSSSNFSSANLSSGNYLSNYLTNNQTSSGLASHHHSSNNSYLAFKSTNSGLGSSIARPLPNSYSSISGGGAYNASSNLYSNRLLTGLSTQPTADIDLIR